MYTVMYTFLIYSNLQVHIKKDTYMYGTGKYNMWTKI